MSIRNQLRNCDLKFELTAEEKGCDSNICCFYCESFKECTARCESIEPKDFKRDHVICECDAQ